jgi:hypothetical protein
MSVAKTAPAVPGPQGQKPAPKPVPIITGKTGGRFIIRLQKYVIISKKAQDVAKKTQKGKKFCIIMLFFLTIFLTFAP